MKTIFKTILLSWLLTSCCIVTAVAAENESRVLLDQTIAFDVPPGYITTESPHAIWSGIDTVNTGNLAIIKTLNIDDFDVNMVFMKLDTMLFNLSAYENIDSEQEHMLDIGRKYYIKNYKSKTDSTDNLATYTFFSFKRPYVMLVKYGSEENYNLVKTIGDGLIHPAAGGWRQLLFYWHFSKGMLGVIFMACLIFPTLLKKLIGQITAVTLTLAVLWSIIIYCMWGFPVAIVISLIITFLTATISSNYSLSEIFSD